MRGTKARKLLAEKKERLEIQIASAERVLEDMPLAIKGELRRVAREIGLNFHQKRLETLTHNQRRLLHAFLQLIYHQALDKHELEETELLLNPPKGRAKGTKNRDPKPLERTIVEALRYRNTPEGRKLTLDQLAQKFNPGGNRTLWRKWKYRLQKAQYTRSR